MYVCQYCGGEFKSKTWRTRHIVLVHPDAPPACSKCEALLTKDNWDAFRQRENQRVCMRCARPTKGNAFQCRICGKGVADKQSLAAHTTRAHPDAEPRCCVCDVVLTDANWLPSRKKKHIHFCRECWKATNTPEHSSQYNKGRTRRLKLEVIEAYGGKCACCGEDIPEFLTVDHINNDGASHRQLLNRGNGSIYAWLKKQGFPKDNYQLLCMNCNFAKGKYGECPHVRKRLVHSSM